MAYVDTVTALGPVAYYRLGEASGTTMVDASGNGHNGTYGGSTLPTLGAAGLVTADTDTAVTFTGSNYGQASPSGTWMDLPVMSAVAAFTIPTATSGGTFLKDGGLEFYVGSSAGTRRLMCDLDTGTTYYSTGATGASVLAAGTVYLAGVVYDGTQLVTYLNGVAEVTLPVSGTKTAAGAKGLIVGAYSTFGDFNGTLDEVALFPTALTAADMADLYASLTGAGSGPTVTATDTTVGSYGYTYTGTGTLDYDPPVAPTPAHVSRAHVRRVSRSLPTPTLTDGSPR